MIQKLKGLPPLFLMSMWFLEDNKVKAYLHLGSWGYLELSLVGHPGSWLRVVVFICHVTPWQAGVELRGKSNSLSGVGCLPLDSQEEGRSGFWHCWEHGSNHRPNPAGWSSELACRLPQAATRTCYAPPEPSPSGHGGGLRTQIMLRFWLWASILGFGWR